MRLSVLDHFRHFLDGALKPFLVYRHKTGFQTSLIQISLKAPCPVIAVK